MLSLNLHGNGMVTRLYDLHASSGSVFELSVFIYFHLSFKISVFTCLHLIFKFENFSIFTPSHIYIYIYIYIYIGWIDDALKPWYGNWSGRRRNSELKPIELSFGRICGTFMHHSSVINSSKKCNSSYMTHHY